MTVFGGDVIYAADINNVIALLPVTYTKVSSTSRASTTTLANDTELVSIPLAVGTYEIELVGFWTQDTTSTQKIKTAWAFTGTWTTVTRACSGPGSAQTGAPAAVTDATFSGYNTDTQSAVYNTSTTGAWSAFREVARNVVVSVAGNLSLQWAQSVSSANNTNLKPGTSFVIRKLP